MSWFHPKNARVLYALILVQVSSKRQIIPPPDCNSKWFELRPLRHLDRPDRSIRWPLSEVYEFRLAGRSLADV